MGTGGLTVHTLDFTKHDIGRPVFSTTFHHQSTTGRNSTRTVKVLVFFTMVVVRPWLWADILFTLISLARSVAHY